jgi:hypothetical protein
MSGYQTLIQKYSERSATSKYYNKRAYNWVKRCDYNGRFFEASDKKKLELFWLL